MKIQAGIARKFFKGAAPVKETSALPASVWPTVCSSRAVQYSSAVCAALHKLTSQTEHSLNLTVV